MSANSYRVFATSQIDIHSVARVRAALAVEWRELAERQAAPHSHAPGQLIGGLSGLISVHTPVGWWVVPATHAIWIPPEVEHGVRSHGLFRGWSVYVAQADCSELPQSPRTLHVSGLLRELVHRAKDFGDTPSLAQQRLTQVLIDEIAVLPEEPLGLPRPKDIRLNRLVDAMLGDLADTRPVEAWAEVASISPRTLARRFLAETGFTLTAWRQRARALRAIELLAAGGSVTTVSLDLGYDTVSGFIAMFSRVMGVTPGQYGRE